MATKITRSYEDYKKKRRNLIIISIVFTVFIVGNFYIFKEISRASQFFNPYIFLVIINIDVVFFLVILAISLRHLIKLFFESKEKKGKLRIKLSIILISMIFFPALIISTVSISLISDATNFWFSGKVENALKSVDDVIAAAIEDEKRKLKMAGELLKNPNISPYYVKKAFDLKAITFTNEKNIPDKIYGKPLSFKYLDFTKSYIRIGDYLRYIVQNGNSYIIIDKSLPDFLIQKKKQVAEIAQIYSEFRHYKKPVRVSYIVTMLTISMFVIGAAIWFGQYIVRNLTMPLEKLVEASKKLASGDLNVRVDVKSSDEIGVLIEEFNNMVKELKNLYFTIEKSNRQLKFNKEYLEAILENARTGVIYVDKFSTIKTVNKAAENILGIKKEDIIDKDVKELLNLLSLNKEDVYKEQTVEFNGKILILKATTIFDKGTVFVIDDITDVIVAEKAHAWKEIAQRIAHEIKNPLTPIKLAAERIERQFKKGNENFEKILEKSVNVIYSEIEHLSKLVKDFRQFATNENLNLEEINLKDFLEELKNSYESENFKVDVYVEKDLYIKGDKKLLKQAFINILQNSFEKLKEGGKVEITAVQKDSNVEIIIKDNGQGISKEEADKIFLPYYSKKPKGSGLGLTITKDIIEKHQGKITAIPSEYGAVFKITLKFL
jgi:two-component system nitrogen regulation sensor histidine kinase NtrY